MRLRAGQRLRRNSDFRAVRELGRRMDCGAFQLTWRIRSADESAKSVRVGVVASRASVGNAVHRNRAKRRLRELYRRHQHLVPPGVDLVLTARGVLLRLEFAEAAQRFVHACGRLPATPPKNA
ncbi:MAG: ribonuclease protein component [Verrucomicrobiota bacterium]|nr:ribonuclease protein component [Verrucomicrobiota bacterium]